MATNFVSYRTCSLGAKVSQDTLERFSQSLHRMVGIEWQMITTFYFFRYLSDVAMATNLVAKMGQNYLPLHLLLCQSKMEQDIATSMGALTAQSFHHMKAL